MDLGVIRGRSWVELGSISVGRSGTRPGSLRFRSGVDLGSTRCRSGADLGSIWSGSGVELGAIGDGSGVPGSTPGPLGVDLRPAWGRFGVFSGSIRGSIWVDVVCAFTAAATRAPQAGSVFGGATTAYTDVHAYTQRASAAMLAAEVAAAATARGTQLTEALARLCAPYLRAHRASKTDHQNGSSKSDLEAHTHERLFARPLLPTAASVGGPRADTSTVLLQRSHGADTPRRAQQHLRGRLRGAGGSGATLLGWRSRLVVTPLC